MQIDNARRELAILGGRGGRGFVSAFARQRIVERPVLHVALAALHHGAAHAGVPRCTERARVGFWKMEMRVGNAEFFFYAMKAQIAVARCV